jgi:hypothetical protein
MMKVDEESDAADTSVEVNVNVDITPEPAVMKHPVKQPKRVMQNQEEDRCKDLTTNKMIIY